MPTNLLKTFALRAHSLPMQGLSVTPVDVPAVDFQTPEFDVVFRDCSPFVWRALRRLGVSERDAEDVLQEVFLCVHQKLPSFEGRSSVRTWVYGICLRKALGYRRLFRVRHEMLSNVTHESSDGPHQEQALDANRARDRLDRVLGTLDDNKRAVFVFFELEGLSIREIAELMETPVQTTYARLYSARREVQSALQAMSKVAP